MWWHTVTHGRGSEGETGRMEWVTSTLHTASEHGVSSITTAYAHTSAAGSRLNWRPPADLNGLFRFAVRQNLVSARVPSHFKRSLPPTWLLPRFATKCDLRGSGRAKCQLRCQAQDLQTYCAPVCKPPILNRGAGNSRYGKVDSMQFDSVSPVDLTATGAQRYRTHWPTSSSPVVPSWTTSVHNLHLYLPRIHCSNVGPVAQSV